MNWYGYGHLLPLRVLEEVRFWKEQEKEHTIVISALIPDLEPAYVQWFAEWEAIFENSERVANQLLKQILPGTQPPAPTSFAVLNSSWLRPAHNRESSLDSYMSSWSKALLFSLSHLPNWLFYISFANPSISWGYSKR
ncbi:DUF2935 domain-containing protein [Paenibacillus sp. 1A_MP2]|uniref:DUF2935 domain-containing protein n=1 Tax=Paenibacillus sp. 1A_MP2 TaxID=3457495 RepID=UPI003FCE01B7